MQNLVSQRRCRTSSCSGGCEAGSVRQFANWPPTALLRQSYICQLDGLTMTRISSIDAICQRPDRTYAYQPRCPGQVQKLQRNYWHPHAKTDHTSQYCPRARLQACASHGGVRLGRIRFLDFSPYACHRGRSTQRSTTREVVRGEGTGLI